MRVWLTKIGRTLLWVLATIGAVVTLGKLRRRPGPRVEDVARQLDNIADGARAAVDDDESAHQRTRAELLAKSAAARSERLAAEHEVSERLRADREARRKAIERMDRDGWL